MRIHINIIMPSYKVYVSLHGIILCLDGIQGYLLLLTDVSPISVFFPQMKIGIV